MIGPLPLHGAVTQAACEHNGRPFAEWCLNCRAGNESCGLALLAGQHLVERDLLLQSLLELIPYAESRLEDMAAEAEEDGDVDWYTATALEKLNRAVALAARLSPRCQSANHSPETPSYGLWTCARCGKQVCATCEGTDSEVASGCCDDCWAERVSETEAASHV